MGKYISDFEEVTEIADDDVFLIENANGTNKKVPGRLINAIKDRINNIIAGSASEVNAAEIIDARTSLDGTTSDTLGDAIRKIESILTNIERNTYTTFDSDVVSSGNIVVIRFLGCLCLVAGSLTMSDTLTSATQILDATKVPANLTGTRYINASNSNKTTWTRPLAVRVTAAGGLDVNYGAAGRYDFSMLYFTS